MRGKVRGWKGIGEGLYNLGLVTFNYKFKYITELKMFQVQFTGADTRFKGGGGARFFRNKKFIIRNKKSQRRQNFFT